MGLRNGYKGEGARDMKGKEDWKKDIVARGVKEN